MAPEVASEPFLPKRTISAHGTISQISSATSVSSGWASEKIMPSSSCARDRRRHVGVAVAERDGGQRIDEIDVLVAVDVPGLAALRRAAMKKGETPCGYCVRLLENVCVPSGIDLQRALEHGLGLGERSAGVILMAV